MKFTEGDWNFSKEESAIRYAVNTENGVHIAMVSCYVDAKCDEPKIQPIEKYNNAVLISAAPDMYKALKSFEKYIEIENGVDEDDDEGFIEILKSRTEAINLAFGALKKIYDNKKD